MLTQLGLIKLGLIGFNLVAYWVSNKFIQVYILIIWGIFIIFIGLHLLF